MRYRVVLLLIGGLLTAGLIPISDSRAAAIYNLGSGGTASVGIAVNASGQVTGYGNPSPNESYRTFLYSNGTRHDLGSLGGEFSFPHSINSLGQIVGDSEISASPADHAFLYSGAPGNGGSMVDLGTLGGSSSYAYDITDGGQIVGYSDTNGNAARHCFSYTGVPGAGGVMKDMGTLGGNDSGGLAVNAAGQIAGWSEISGSHFEHAFLYTSYKSGSFTLRKMFDLGTLGGTDSVAWALNGAGQVAGWSRLANNVASHAFLHRGDPGIGAGHMDDLGTLGGTDSEAYAINLSGQVVGTSDIAGDSATRAFLYTGTPGAGGHMIDLDAWLDANNPTDGAYWTLTGARDITDSGLITGYGTYNDGPGGLSDGTRAFLLDASALVPEPAHLSLLALTAILAPRRRR